MAELQIPHMKTIGVIGGLGPQATLDVLRRIQKVCQERIRQEANSGYLPLYVGFCREAPMMLTPDGLVQEPLAPSAELLDVARKIGAIADAVIMASNTPHLFLSEVRQAAGCPVLSIVDAAVAEVLRRGCKKIGIIAVGEALKHGLYQRALDAEGMTWAAISPSLSRILDKSIFAVMEGMDPTAGSQPAEEAAEYLRAQGADAIILGCTEVPLLLGHGCDAPDIINPSQLIAEAAVQYAIGA